VNDLATFADVISAGFLAPIFSFLFMIVIVSAFAHFVPWLQDKKWLAIAFGVLVGFLTLLSPIAIGLVQYIVPWFAIVMVFIALIMSVTKFLGTGGTGIGTGMDLKGLYGVLAAVVLTFILIGAANYVRDATLYGTEQGEDVYQAKPMSAALIIFNPILLGTIILFAIAGFAVALLSAKPI